MKVDDLHRAALTTVKTSWGEVDYYRLSYLKESCGTPLEALPFSIRLLLENALRNMDGNLVTEEDVRNVAGWNPSAPSQREFPFMPTRVLMQDFTGVPAVVDLAAMRSAMARMGADPTRVNPTVPVDLVVDHSVQVDYFGRKDAFRLNVEREFQRNTERYALLRWAQKTFTNFRVVPPGTGIVHQVNLEYLASVVTSRQNGERIVSFPDTVVGTDSHTTMINGLGVLGWGVGGIEAEGVLLGQPYYMQLPQVVGVKLTGSLRQGVTATDLVLTITQILRKRGVVEKFVEFFGSGLSNLPLPDRATIANMAPEYGATCGFFPVDQVTLRYLEGTGRDPRQVELVELYCRNQELYRTDETVDPVYSDTLHVDLGDIEPSMAGPRRPQDRLTLDEVKPNFYKSFGVDLGIDALSSDKAQTQEQRDEEMARASRTDPKWNLSRKARIHIENRDIEISDGSVVIAAITSCTNTSNPSVMIGAGLLAKKAVEIGLKSKPWVKTSMAPGSQVVTDYLNAAGVVTYLESLGFHNVGYGCTTCIGNSGPLPEAVSQAVRDNDLVVASVLSGNRNFDGRVHGEVKANYLASPMLVVAYALAGTVDMDIANDPLGIDVSGRSVYLRDIWPSQEEIQMTLSNSLEPSMFANRYSGVFAGSEQWEELPVPEGELYQWDPESTYIQEVPFFVGLTTEITDPVDIEEAPPLVILGDSVTTDHISPAGAIPNSRPSGQYLLGRGVERAEFNTFGARRGNHDVMMRGTFANVRLRNRLTPSKEGDWTLFIPSGEEVSIFEAAMRYMKNGTPTVVIAGKEYGSGSSRDWAAKGPALLGVRAVLAESYERIHRSNLLGMGVLPLQFLDGQNAENLGLSDMRTFSITGVTEGLSPGQKLPVKAVRQDGGQVFFDVLSRLDTRIEVEYYRNGGVLQTVLRQMLNQEGLGKGER